MQIVLQEPFISRWRNGYLVSDNENRKRVILYNSEEDRWGVTYARYLMCVKLGYILPTELEVDHINDDKTDDRIENLQILTAEQNRLKQWYHYVMHQQVCYGFHCACCETPFILTEAEVNERIKTSKTGLAFCSHSCAHFYTVSSRQISNEMILHVKQLRQEGFSSYKISDLTGLARNTVMKYW